MKLDLIQKSDEVYAKEKLDTYYEGSLLPSEKKQYLTDLKSSHGPYMGIEGADGKPHYLMDAASQIATLGLGFNPSVFLGPAHYLESWTNENHTQAAKELRASFEAFLKRKTGWDNLHTTFCNSGAEANEIALGYCYRNRKNKNAKKVLAFEGSFHGRMLVSLQATWNPSKREPFLFPNFEAVFCDYPELQDDKVNLELPDGWQDLWDNATNKEFSTPSEWKKDKLLNLEVDALLKVRNELLKGEIFSIIVEPMQCEGGDRYSSNRFHTALLLMAKSFGIGVIHDEVQTGFHLGKEFFWHRTLDMKNADGSQLNPDYVVCAKKAQIGMVISHADEVKLSGAAEEYSMVSMIRGYFHAVALDQSQGNILKLEDKSRQRLEKLIAKHSEHIARPRLMGMSFAFDLLNQEKVSDFIAARFDHGLLYYPAGSKTLRFRLNTAFSDKDLDFLFERLDQIVSSVLGGKKAELVNSVETNFRAPENLYKWHEALVKARLELLFKGSVSEDPIKYASTILTSADGIEGSELVELTRDNFSKYKDDIKAIQKEVYEPSRQTPIEVFETSVSDGLGVGLLLVNDNKIEAVAISGKMGNFPKERILRRDPSFEDEKSLYMVDCTVRPGHRGKGLGRQIKSALNLVAMGKAKNRIVGRNRDRMAAAMLSINLGLGAREKFYVPEDYPDFEEYRDVFYYTNDLTWSEGELRLDNGITSPLTARELNQEYLIEQLPFLTNKVCLSNFVSLRYLDHFKELFSQLPAELQHGYSASGQSECVDKISKSMFVAEKETGNTRHEMISFKGHYFGLGSFMSRSLSKEEDTYFPVKHFDSPNQENWKEILKQIQGHASTDKTLAIWLEPLPQNLLEPLPLEFLKELRDFCTQKKVNLVYNETASSMYRYDASTFCAGSNNEIKPDAGFIFMGAQAAMVFANEDNFLAKPLMMISTWDGDEFSYAGFTKALEHINSDLETYQKTRNEFSNKIGELVSKQHQTTAKLHNGVGVIEGNLPHSLSKLLTPLGSGRYKLLPSYGAMKKFLEVN